MPKRAPRLPQTDLRFPQYFGRARFGVQEQFDQGRSPEQHASAEVLQLRHAGAQRRCGGFGERVLRAYCMRSDGRSFWNVD